MTTKSKSKSKTESTQQVAQNKTSIFLDDKEYFLEDMTPEQQVVINHISDLDNKIQKAQFEVNQYSVGKQAFIDMLQKSLDSSDS